jgi:hypothetical protein
VWGSALADLRSKLHLDLDDAACFLFIMQIDMFGMIMP